MRVHKRIRYNYFHTIQSSCMELESKQIIYVIWHLCQSPKEIAQSTDISSLNVCNASLITYSIEVLGKMIKKNDGRFTIHITSTVQKILRTCTGKQTIEGVPVSESLSIIFHYSTIVCLKHQPWIFSSPYYSMCAASNLWYLGDCSSPKVFVKCFRQRSSSWMK